MADIETIELLAKKKAFFYQSDEIYGGFAGFYTYGHMGTLMKRKLENIWRKYFLNEDNFYEIDPPLIMSEKVFEASGHLKGFVDPVAKCTKCNTSHRADHILESFLGRTFEGMTPEKLTKLIIENNIKCPKCKGKLGESGILNMMFSMEVGAEKNAKGYLRPETAQGAYVNFSNQFTALRKRIPLGLAIVGKSFRNEISPRQLTIRMREFTQAELQIFFDPEKIDEHEDWEDVKSYKLTVLPVSESDKKASIQMSCQELSKTVPKFYVRYMAKVQKFFFDVLGIEKDKFRFRELSEDERAFYNKIHWDMELDTESLGGFKEVGGVHYRSDHDLLGHQKVSKQKQEVFFDNKKFIPHVLELSFGVDRILYSLLDLSYSIKDEKVVLKLPAHVAPITVSVFPLVNKNGLDKKAEIVCKELDKHFDVFYDGSGSIGRRYARSDEAGTPFAVTIDFDTEKDSTVTLRYRDTAEQERVKIDDLAKIISEKFK
ncbi:MAG: glycine--tRNA ligase [Candidatus Aenigmatarchaeota archaeon]